MAQKYPKIAQNGPKMTQNCPNGDISSVSPTFCISAGKHPMGQVSSIITIAKYHPSYKKTSIPGRGFLCSYSTFSWQFPPAGARPGRLSEERRGGGKTSCAISQMFNNSNSMYGYLNIQKQVPLT